MFAQLVAERRQGALDDREVEHRRPGLQGDFDRDGHVEVVSMHALLGPVGEDGHMGAGELVLVLLDDELRAAGAGDHGRSNVAPRGSGCKLREAGAGERCPQAAGEVKVFRSGLRGERGVW